MSEKNIKRVLVTGANGLLGQKMVKKFSSNNEFDVVATATGEQLHDSSVSCRYQQLDISDRKAVKEIVRQFSPDLIINCAAMTHVDKCESEKELCHRINTDGVQFLAESCKPNNIRFIHFSTDYVFDGVNGPYNEESKVNPLSYYGKSKLAGENAIIATGIDFIIFRTMVVYGVGIKTKANFASWLVNELKQNRPVNIVTDQIGNVTLVDELAEATMIATNKNIKGIYHAAGKDLVSRYDFAVLLAQVFNFDTQLIHPITTDSLKQLAPRPLNSGLITIKVETELGYHFSTTKEGLVRFKQQMKTQNLI